MTPARPRIAIVIPCYNEEEALKYTVAELLGILDGMAGEDAIAADSYLLCVNDGSGDGTWQEIVRLHGAHPERVHGVNLAHNRGHQFALLAGLMTARDNCDAAISIDADLQDDPRAIIRMVEAFKQGAEIVYGVRQSRQSDSWFKRTTARKFYRLQRAMGLQTVYDHADYRLMSRRALDILSEYGEQNLFLRGIVPLIGLDTAVVKYDRAERVAGESKYPLRKMVSFSIDGITSFSAQPMQWIFGVGFSILVVDIVVALYVLVSNFWGHTVSGWSSLMMSLWFIGSLILMGLGIIGEYIGKIYIEVKQRPRFNIKDRV